MTNSTGTVTLAKSYDPYGTVTHTNGAAQSAYGFTGEMADVSGLTYLRARYYSPLDGRFMSRDTWEGNYNRPLSLNRWMYTVGNPTNLTDPSGKFPEWCKSMQERIQYENCVRQFYNLSAPKNYPTMPKPEGSSGCWSGPVAYKAPGYLEGYSVTFSFEASYSFGKELVFDFGTMEKGLFDYETVGLNLLEASITAMEYHGVVFGFNNVDTIEGKYKGPYFFGSGGVNSGVGLGVGVNAFVSFDGELWGLSQYYSIGASISLFEGFSFSEGVGLSSWHPGYQKVDYIGGDEKVKVPSLINNITLDADSPAVIPAPSNLVKADGIALAYHYSWIHDEIYVNSK